jgi:hypothetical protein
LNHRQIVARPLQDAPPFLEPPRSGFPRLR